MCCQNYKKSCFWVFVTPPKTSPGQVIGTNFFPLPLFSHCQGARPAELIWGVCTWTPLTSQNAWDQIGFCCFFLCHFPSLPALPSGRHRSRSGCAGRRCRWNPEACHGLQHPPDGEAGGASRRWEGTPLVAFLSPLPFREMSEVAKSQHLQLLLQVARGICASPACETGLLYLWWCGQQPASGLAYAFFSHSSSLVATTTAQPGGKRWWLQYTSKQPRTADPSQQIQITYFSCHLWMKCAFHGGKQRSWDQVLLKRLGVTEFGIICDDHKRLGPHRWSWAIHSPKCALRASGRGKWSWRWSTSRTSKRPSSWASRASTAASRATRWSRGVRFRTTAPDWHSRCRLEVQFCCAWAHSNKKPGVCCLIWLLKNPKGLFICYFWSFFLSLLTISAIKAFLLEGLKIGFKSSIFE